MRGYRVGTACGSGRPFVMRQRRVAEGHPPPRVVPTFIYSPNMATMSLTMTGANSPRLTARVGSKQGPGTATN